MCFVRTSNRQSVRPGVYVCAYVFGMEILLRWNVDKRHAMLHTKFTCMCATTLTIIVTTTIKKYSTFRSGNQSGNNNGEIISCFRKKNSFKGIAHFSTILLPALSFNTAPASPCWPTTPQSQSLPDSGKFTKKR